MDRERLRRIRNFQSQDFYPALVIRPITILVMLVIADWRFLTPNRLTTVANIWKLLGAWLMFYPDHWVLAAIMLQLGLLFDHLDGTVARYRRTFTKLGSYYDKVSDIFTWDIIVMVVGWEAYRAHGEALFIVGAAASVIGLDIRGYMKWLNEAEGERLRWFEAKADPIPYIAKRTAPIVIAPPPDRSAADWVRWFFMRLAAIFAFEEMDLWFWLGLGLVIGRLDLLIWLLVLTQVPGAFVMAVVRAVKVHRIDRRLRELESTGT